MLTVDPLLGAWAPQNALKPIRLTSGAMSAGTDVAMFTPVQLGAAPYDFVPAFPTRVAYTPILDCNGYSCFAWYWSCQTRTGVAAETLEMIPNSISPVPVAGSGARLLADEGTGALGIGAMTINYFGRKTFPSTVTTAGAYPFCYARTGITLSAVGAITDLKFWFWALVWNPGYRS